MRELNKYQEGGRVSLYYNQGASDKEYHIQLEDSEGGYIVNFQYGRRGKALKSGTKTSIPVSLEQAQKIYDKLLNSKLSKGYVAEMSNQTNSFSTTPTQKMVHKLPQLLNMVFTTREFINDDSYLSQEKMDGERRMVIRDNLGITIGLNKKGQDVPLPSSIIDSINNECIIDGEIIGDKLYAFDILSLDGRDLEGEPCIQRVSTLNTLSLGGGVKVVETAYNTEEKQEMFDKLERENREGIVFKKKDAPYTHGRPSSGGNQLKFKFYKTATFIVSNHTPGKRSVGLELIDNGQKVFMGKVTIPPNKDIPNVGDLVEVRYLYAYKGGAIYQPTYIWKREDSDLTDATIDQIIYKAEDYAKGGDVVDGIWMVDNPNESPEIFNYYIKEDVSGSNDPNSYRYHKEIVELGQRLDRNNSNWRIGNLIIEVSGRKIVDVYPENDRPFLMYQSLGEGTGIESKGMWVPLIGFARNGWFIKNYHNGENPKFNKYGSKTFKNISNYLGAHGNKYAKGGSIYAEGGEVVEYEVPYERLVDGEYENEIKTFEKREDAEKFAKEHYSYVDEVSYAEGGEINLPNGVFIDTRKTTQSKDEILEMYSNQGYTAIGGGSLLSDNFKKYNRDIDIYIVVGEIKHTSNNTMKGRIYMKKNEVAVQNFISKNIDAKVITKIHNTDSGSTYAEGGEVEKKENNEMIIGGLAGILLGIFLNK